MYDEVEHNDTCVKEYVHMVCFFFFKQKTAYEMRISDWSSDWCSSDLAKLAALREEADRLENEWSGQADIPDEIDARVTAIDEEISAIVSRPPVFTPEDMAMAGVFVSIDVDGSLYVERGFVRPEDEPIEHDDDGVITDGDESDGIDSSDDLEDGPSPAVVSVGLPGTASEREESGRAHG